MRLTVSDSISGPLAFSVSFASSPSLVFTRSGRAEHLLLFSKGATDQPVVSKGVNYAALAHSVRLVSHRNISCPPAAIACCATA